MNAIVVIEMNVHDDMLLGLVQLSEAARVIRDVATPEMNKEGITVAIDDQATKVLSFLKEADEDADIA